MNGQCVMCRHWKSNGGYVECAPTAEEAAELVKRAAAAAKKKKTGIAPGSMATATVKRPAGTCAKWDGAITWSGQSCKAYEPPKSSRK